MILYEIQWTVTQRVWVPEAMDDDTFDAAMDHIDMDLVDDTTSNVFSPENKEPRKTDLYWSDEKMQWEKRD